MQLCVALDHEEKSANIALAKELKSFDIWLKVGFRSYIRDGRGLIDELKQINPSFKIFLDLKLYDIPNTMADAASEIAMLGVDMFNVHASSGFEAMNTVMKRLDGVHNRPLVLAVTALTSFSNDAFRAVYNDDITTKAPLFASDANRAGLDGVVCSAFESALIKSHTREDFLTLTPGIRPFGEDANDQERVATLDIAHDEKVDFIVVGRPIYKAADPKIVVKKIISKL